VINTDILSRTVTELSLLIVQILDTLRLGAPFGGLRENIRWSSYAHWKARSGLPISVNWTVFARCYGWGATSEYRFNIGDVTPTWAGWPKISGRKDSPPTNHSSSQKTRLNDLLCGVKNWTDLFFRFVTILAFDRRTDGRTAFSSIDHVCIACSAEKMTTQSIN